MTVELITTDEGLRAFADRVRGESRLGFDTEAASFHRYVDRVYLVQASSDNETAIIDPLAVRDLGPVGRLLADPEIEVVFHDADYDLRSLDRDYGFRARRVFDTRIAAQLLGEPAVGLGALLQKHFGVTLNKKLQRADWSVRPLTPEMIEYAGADTSRLPALRDLLETELRRVGRLDWAAEEFSRLEAVRWNGIDGSPDDYVRLKGARLLAPRSQVVLRALYGWREDRARALDRAPFRILQNEALVILAQEVPRDVAALSVTAGLPSTAADRYGAELLEVIAKALEGPVVVPPKKERSFRPRPDAEGEKRFERLKQLRNARARELGIEPGVLGANAALETIARNAAGPASQGGDGSTAPELRRWQRAALGESGIQAALSGQTESGG